MSKYVRIEPRLAADPMPRMRVYGRTSWGAWCVLVVHEVSGGSVRFARRIRGHGPDLLRYTLDSWSRQIRGSCDRGDIVGVQVSRPADLPGQRRMSGEDDDVRGR